MLQVLKKTYCHDAHVMPVNEIKRTLGTCQTLDLEEEERLTRLMNRLVDQVKVQWDKYSPGSATWEDAETL